MECSSSKHLPWKQREACNVSPLLKGVYGWETIFRCACFDYDNVNDDHVQGQNGRGKHLYQKDMRRKRKRKKNTLRRQMMERKRRRADGFQLSPVERRWGGFGWLFRVEVGVQLFVSFVPVKCLSRYFPFNIAKYLHCLTLDTVTEGHTHAHVYIYKNRLKCIYTNI